MTPVLRFAPSPNGELHLGHAYSALLNRDLARRLGGRLLLRIEDIDLGRCRPEFETRIYEDLAWLGLDWERPVRRQSEHFGEYGDALARLTAMGVLYPCFATRKEIAEAAAAAGGGTMAADPDGAPLYPGLYRGAAAETVNARMAAGDGYTLRLDMARVLAALRENGGTPLTVNVFDPATDTVTTREAQPERWGDAVLARKDVPASYHLAVVLDDALQGVTHVVRGQDLEAASDLHRLLQELLGLPAPLYHHHRLIVDGEGRKLSKRDKDKSLRSLRGEGVTPAGIRRMLDLPD
jgi:glutamyl-Q tRNA(Asp) synthetase